jgi:cytochrome-b5 reductase
MLGVIKSAPRALTAGLGGITAITTYALYTTESATATAAANGLDPNQWTSFKLVHKEQLTKGTPTPTFLFRLEAPAPIAEMPVASCLLTRAPIGSVKEDGSPAFVMRPYTPVSGPREKDHIDLAIKVYPSGKMSRHLVNLKLGQTIDVKGPIKKIDLAELAKKKHVGMIAGGTGLTPMLQVIEEALQKKLSTQWTLLYASVSEHEIMLRDKLEKLAAAHPRHFKLHLLVDRAESKSWPKDMQGYVTKDMLKKVMPSPGEGSMVLVCGPPPMMKAVSGDKAEDKSQGELSGLLKDLGFTEKNVFKF